MKNTKRFIWSLVIAAVAYGIFSILHGWKASFEELDALLNTPLSQVKLGTFMLTAYFYWAIFIRNDEECQCCKKDEDDETETDKE